MKIQNFTDLVAWKQSHLLVLEIYKILRLFPRYELHALTDQMRRCVISITSNVAEGFSRQGKKEKLQFYYMSKGSLTELQNQLLIARDVGYIDNITFQKLAKQTIEASKLITGLIHSVKNRA
jgi:four helix bundle protein